MMTKLRRFAVGIGFVAVHACAEPSRPIEVLIGPAAHRGVEQTATDVVAYLARMHAPAGLEHAGGHYVCEPSARRIVWVGDGLSAEVAGVQPAAGGFSYQTERCGRGWLVVLRGSDPLARQHAGYAWLHETGVRFFHPEDEYVPDHFALPAAEQQSWATGFRDRSVSLHLIHPLELGDVIMSDDESRMPEGRRYVDWLVKNYATEALSGAIRRARDNSVVFANAARLLEYANERGFPTVAELRLYGGQQGTSGILDGLPTSPWREQLDTALAQRLDNRDASKLIISFDPSEFTQIDDRLVVEQLSYIADRVAAQYPAVRVTAINHGTHSAPTPHYGIRYYDLPTLAGRNLGMMVHPLMFYDLSRPAPVYGNQNFNHFADLIQNQHTQREITYFPESAWWLTFDIAVPLYLPITIEARDRDIQFLRPFMPRGDTASGDTASGVVGHHVFGSGHEWGYWQNEYCSLQMSAHPELRWQDCIREITGLFEDAASETQAVVEQAVRTQQEFMFDAEMLVWLLGTDAETEAAASVGVVFHPLPASPETLGQWTETQVRDFSERIEPRLVAIDTAFAGMVERLQSVRASVPQASLGYFDEIRDGLEMFALRARHQRLLYAALVEYRRQVLIDPAHETMHRALALSQISSAEMVSTQAMRVVARRESAYRYHPLQRSIGGGDNGSEDENWSTYRYRYLNRTHRLFYYRDVDRRARAYLESRRPAVEIDDALVPIEQAHRLHLDGSLGSVDVAWGDGTDVVSAGPVAHTYASVGRFLLRVSSAAQIHAEISVGALQSESHTGFTGRLVYPMGIALIEGVLPAVVFGHVASDMALGFSANASDTVRPEHWALAGTTAQPSAGDIETTVPRDIQIPLVRRADGGVHALLQARDVVLHLRTGSILLNASLERESIVQAVVTIGNGSFDASGARALLATTLGYGSPADIPELVEVQLRYELQAR